MREIVKLFKALSDPNRIRILKMLELRPLCVCEITEVLQLATSTVSKHLSILRDVDLIIDNKEGKWVNYKLNMSGRGINAKELLVLIGTSLNDDRVICADFRRVKEVDRNTICQS